MNGTVFCLGDSLTYGNGSEFIRAYPEELTRLLQKRLGPGWCAINEGINGQVSTFILRRMFRRIVQFENITGKRYGCILAGTNDSMHDYPHELYKDNLRQMVNMFRRFKYRPILFTLPAVEENPIGIARCSRKNSWLKEANTHIEALAKELDVPLVSMDGMEEYLMDTVHFNHAGHKEMARRCFDVIEKIETTDSTTL